MKKSKNIFKSKSKDSKNKQNDVKIKTKSGWIQIINDRGRFDLKSI